MSAKRLVIDMIERLPEDTSLDDIFERLYLRVRVNELGRVLDVEEIERPSNARLAAALRWARVRRREELAVLLLHMRDVT